MGAAVLPLLLEFTRAEQADDPYAFRSGRQSYLLRAADGTFAGAELDWDAALLAELAAVRQPGSDPALRQRLGDRLRRFVTPLGWPDYAAQLTAALAAGQRVVVTVRSAAAELYALPWELLTLRGSGQHLGELAGVLLRYEWPGTASAPATASADSERLLFAYSSAGGAVPAAEHLAAIASACQQAALPFDSEGDVLRQVSAGRLAAVLAAAQQQGRPIAVLHLLAHGTPLGSTFGLSLSGPAAGDDPVPIDAGQLRQLLSPYAGMLRLVVLCACDGGNGGALGNHLGSLAQALHRCGLPAVVASRYPLSVAGSVQLAQTLYGELLGGPRSLEAALLAVRRRLAAQSPVPDWASVQLYARSADGDDSRPITFRPFRGLLAFQPEHQRFFFGRDREIAAIQAALTALRQRRQPRFLIVAGASGSGKSSLVLAGAVPRILAAATAAGTPLGLVRLRAGDAAGLAALEADAATPRLVVCDQLEEIFTHVAEPALRQAWLRRLWQLGSSELGGVSVLLTLRVDFIGRCGEILLDSGGRRLDSVAYDEAHRIFVAQLSPAQLAEVIRAPVEQSGLLLDEGLGQRMLQAVDEQPGALPLLEYTLDLLWLRRRGRTLGQADYDQLGGVSGALQGRAEALLLGLPLAQQQAVRRLLVRLVQVGDDPSQGTRRRLDYLALRPRSDAAAVEFEQALGELCAARLVVRAGAGSQQTVEIAHEALIRKWPRLLRWVGEDRQQLAEIEKLEGWAADRDSDSLLAGKQLDRAEEIADKYAADLSLSALELVAASQRGRRRQRRQQQATLVAISATAIVAALFGWYGLASSRREAQARRDESQQRQRAEAAAERANRQLYDSYVERGRVLLVERNDPVRALLWLNRAYQNGHATPALRFLLAQSYFLAAALRYRVAGRAPTFSPDGSYLATEASGTVSLYAASSGQLLHNFPGRTVSFAPDSRQLVVVADGGQQAVVIDCGSGQTLLTHRTAGRPIASAVLSPDRAQLVTLSTDGQQLTIVATADGSVQRQLSLPPLLLAEPGNGTPQPSSRAVHFSRDGRRLVSDGSCPALIWDAQSGKQLWRSASGDGRPCRATYRGASDRLLLSLPFLGDNSSPAEVWDTAQQRLVENGRLVSGEALLLLSPDGQQVLFQPESGPPTVRSLRDGATDQPLAGVPSSRDDPHLLFSPSGRLLAASDPSGLVGLWTLEPPQLSHTFVARGAPSSFSEAAGLVATVAAGNESQVYDVGRRFLLPGLQAARSLPPSPQPPRRGFDKSPDGKLLLDESEDATVLVRAVAGGAVRQRIEAPERNRVSFSADGSYVITWTLGAAVGADGDYPAIAAKLWDVETGVLLAVLGADAAQLLVASLDRKGSTVRTATGEVWQLHQALTVPPPAELQSYVDRELRLHFVGDLLIGRADPGTH